MGMILQVGHFCFCWNCCFWSPQIKPGLVKLYRPHTTSPKKNRGFTKGSKSPYISGTPRLKSPFSNGFTTQLVIKTSWFLTLTMKMSLLTTCAADPYTNFAPSPPPATTHREKLCRKGRYVLRWPSIPWINMPTWISHPFQKVWLVAVEISRHPVIHLEFRWFVGMFFWGGKSYLLSWGVWMSRCLFFWFGWNHQVLPLKPTYLLKIDGDRWTFLWKWSLFRGHVNLTVFLLGGNVLSRSFESSKTTKKNTQNSNRSKMGSKTDWAMKKGTLSCLGYIGDQTTQLNADYKKSLYGSLLNKQYNGM